MDSLIIGIVGREEEINDISYYIISKNNYKYLKGKCSYIGIFNNDNKIDINVLDLCDGIIITGGNDIHDYHFYIVDYCYRKNKPILGICMGCQIIGLYSFNGSDEDLIKIDNHKDKDHSIDINKDSILYDIFGAKINVNSRHDYVLPIDKTKYKINAICNNNIEGIEKIDEDHFLLGLQWHPEDMNSMEKIYNYYLKEVLIRKLSRLNK